MTLYPYELDSDLEIPRVDANITEVSGDVINALRDAVFAIEKTLGISLQGNKPSFSDRISVSIDDNGRIKSSALNGIGLVTLPITNSHIGSAAAIAESKLNLDYSTQSLKNSISSLQTNVSSFSSDVLSLSSRLNGHTLGQSDFHDGYQIKINKNIFVGVAGLTATTIGAAINELSTILLSGNESRVPHIDLSLPTSVKHKAESISVSSSEFEILDNATSDLQSLAEDIDLTFESQQKSHIDGFHSNGIFRNISSGAHYNSSQERYSTSGASYTSGTSVIKIPGVGVGGAPSFSYLKIYSGSIIDIETPGDDFGSYQILETGPLTASETLGNLPTLSADELYISHIFDDTKSLSDDISVTLYDASSVSSEISPLACSIKHNVTLVDSISILNPNSARVVSLGFNGDIIGVDGYEINIEVGLDNSQVRGLTIPNLNRYRLSGALNYVDAQSVAERINAYVSDPDTGNHFPISAFAIGNEICIAHNMVGPQYTLKILDGYSANYALGLDTYGANVSGRIIRGNSNNTYNINGKSLNTIKTFNGTSSLNASTNVIPVYDLIGSLVDPTIIGAKAGGVLNITGHPTLDVNGSYTISSVSSAGVTIFAAESIPVPSVPTTFDVSISNSFVSLEDLKDAGESDEGLVQIYVSEDGYTIAKQKVIYESLGNNVQIINISENFPTGAVQLNITGSGDLRIFNVVSDSVSGETKTVHKDFEGTFKLYHINNIDYVLVKTTGTISAASSKNMTVYRSLNEDEAMELCIVHFDGSITIANIVDTRLFGNLGIDQIRDDVIEIVSQRPVSELRSNGVIRGFELMNLSYSDGYSGMHAIPLSGGVAYVGGVRCEVETQKVVVKSYNEAENLLDGYRVIGINEFGTIRAFSDELGEILTDGYNSDYRFGKILPLYQLELKNGLIYSVIDLRLFINSLDEKIELIVDETNNRVGNFKTLDGALLYAKNYPGLEKLTIKIINSVSVSSKIEVPNGISIIGASAFGGGRHKIINSNDLNDDFIILKGNNRLENLEINSTTIQMDGALILVDASNINIEKCLITFSDTDSISSNSSDIGIKISSNATTNINIVNNRINNVFSGIVADYGNTNITIIDNTIENVSGSVVEACGIKLGSSYRGISSALIRNNKISVPNIGASDIRGISVDVGNTIGTLMIAGNSVTHLSGTTVTNGIRVENISVTGNVVEELYISDNTIYGVKTNDNDIWGVWASNSEIATITNNIIRQVGQGNADDGFIGVGENVDFVKISGNILQEGSVSYGIYKATTDVSIEKALIVNNTITNIGTSAYYIYGTTAYSTIDNNILDGSGDRGVHWSGAYSKISNNNMSDAAGAYSFASYGIYTTASDLDIIGNTINGLNSGAVGIATNTGRDRIKILSNTISGDEISSLISIHGNNHIISKNKLRNTTDSTSSFMTLTTVEDSLIDGNILQGAATNAFLESGTTSRVTFSGNNIAATVTNAFNLSNADDCFFFGNKSSDSATNTIGATPATATVNTNLVGINRGFLDTVGVSMAEGVASASSEWDLSGTDDSWSPAATGATYYLYFSLNKIPNGARITSVDVSGTNPAGGVLTLDIFRKSMKSAFAIDSISTVSITIASAAGDFGPGQATTCEIIADTTSDVNIVNYEESNYYLRVATDGAVSTSAKIHGVTINFRY